MKRTCFSFLFIIISITCFGQKKKICQQKLDSQIVNLQGSWKFDHAIFYPSGGKKEDRYCKSHILTFDKNKYSVRRSIDSAAYQEAKVKTKKENPARFDNCAVMVIFNAKQYFPDEDYDFDSYYSFWIIESCTNDTLVLSTPNSCSFKGQQCGQAIRYFTRQK